MYRLVLVFLFTFAPIVMAVHFGHLDVREEPPAGLTQVDQEVSGLRTLAASPEEVVRAEPDLYSMEILGSDLTALRRRQELRSSSSLGFDAYSPDRNGAPLGGPLFMTPPLTN